MSSNLSVGGQRGGNSRGEGDTGQLSGDGNGRSGDQGIGRKGGERQRSHSPIGVNVRQFNETVVKQPVAKRTALLGSEGKAVNLIVNHFAVNYEGIPCFYYNVEINLQRRDGNGFVTNYDMSSGRVQNDRRQDNIEVIDRMARDSPMFAKVVHFFDGNKNFYTNKRLSDEFTREVTTTLDGYPEQTFHVNMTFVKKLPMNVIKDLFEGRVQNPTLDMFREDLQVLDIALAYRVKRTRVPVGRNLYSRTNRWPIDGLNAEVGFGYHQSLVLTECGLTVNVDRKVRLFRSGGTLLEFIRRELEVFFQRSLSAEDMKTISFSFQLCDEMSRVLKDLKIFTTHVRGGEKLWNRVRRMIRDRAYEHQFWDNSVGKYNNIENHFFSTFGPHLRQKYNNHNQNQFVYRNIPLIQGNGNKHLPVEMCQVYPHQPMPDLVTTDAMQRVIVGVSNSQSPLKRFDKIVASVEDIIHESQPLMSAFGLTVSTRPIKLVGRVLPAPTVRGCDRRLKDGVQLNNYLFINITSRVVRNDVLEFWKGIVTTARGMGIEITTASDGMPIHYTSAIDPDIEKLFIDGVKNDYQMIFVCLQDRRLNVVFEDYKHWDRVYGIVTQCIKDENLLNPRSGYNSYIPQKIRSKLDRQNMILDPTVRQHLFPNNVMIVGVDVSHPANNERNMSSIAALVGSYDPELTKFFANVSAQGMRTEIISNFDEMFGKLLDQYRDRNGSYPQNVIVFRDGVSENQYQEVIDIEIALIEKAFVAKGVNSKPKVTVIISQKRINTRFIPYEVELTFKGREVKNIKPGTVVDHIIVSPLFNEFFLCSHKGLLGTSRPTKYIVLRNEHSFSAESLQKITYYMCYAYNRCSTPISVPIPVKYSQSVALGAKQHILNMNLSVEGQVNDSESTEERAERFARNIDAFNAGLEVDPKMAFLPYYS